MLEDKYKKNLPVNAVCKNDTRSGNDNALQSISGVNNDAADKQAQMLKCVQALSVAVLMIDNSSHGNGNAIIDCDNAEMHARLTPAAKSEANMHLIEKLREKRSNSSQICSDALECQNEMQTDNDDDRQETDGIKNDATDVFTFDNTIFNVTNDYVDDSNFNESVECSECLHERMKHANDMKRVLKIKRRRGFLRCYLLLRDGRRITCRPMQVPLKLMSEYRLRNYKRNYLLFTYCRNDDDTWLIRLCIYGCQISILKADC